MKIKDFISFYSENDSDKGCFSNWYKCNFEIDGIVFTSSEQYFMYIKAVTFKDSEMANAILNTSDLKKIKDYGRKVKNYDSAVWNGIRQLVMYDAVKAKFSQNEKIKEKLLSTGNAVLAECAKNDLVWGIGLHADEPECLDTDKWHGQNLLGFTLMKVRGELMNMNIKNKVIDVLKPLEKSFPYLEITNITNVGKEENCAYFRDKRIIGKTTRTGIEVWERKDKYLLIVPNDLLTPGEIIESKKNSKSNSERGFIYVNKGGFNPYDYFELKCKLYFQRN